MLRVKAGVEQILDTSVHSIIIDARVLLLFHLLVSYLFTNTQFHLGKRLVVIAI